MKGISHLTNNWVMETRLMQNVKLILCMEKEISRELEDGNNAELISFQFPNVKKISQN